MDTNRRTRIQPVRVEPRVGNRGQPRDYAGFGCAYLNSWKEPTQQRRWAKQFRREGLRDARLFLFLKDACIDRFSRARDGLEIELFAGDLNKHEGPIYIEAFECIHRWAKVVKAELTRISQNEIVDPLLGF
jgi:hypothetical protein